MSEANHTAELVKEICRMTAADLDQISDAKETVIFEGKEIVLQDPKLVDFDSTKQLGDLFGLSVWLREAIRAKDAGLEFFKNTEESTFNVLFEHIDIPYPILQAVTALKAFEEKDAVTGTIRIQYKM